MNAAIHTHILLFLNEENIYIWDSSKMEDFYFFPSQENFDNLALRKDIRVLPANSKSGVFSFSLHSCRPFFFWRKSSSACKCKLISWPWKLGRWKPLVLGEQLSWNKRRIQRNWRELKGLKLTKWKCVRHNKKKRKREAIRTENDFFCLKHDYFDSLSCLKLFLILFISLYGYQKLQFWYLAKFLLSII